VNGDDPEAVVLATGIAMDFRQEFGMDVVLDIVCFRRSDTTSRTRPPSRNPDVQEDRTHPGVRSCMRTSWSRRARRLRTNRAMTRAYRLALDQGRQTVDPVLTTSRASTRSTGRVSEPQVDRQRGHAIPVTELKGWLSGSRPFPTISSCIRWSKR